MSFTGQPLRHPLAEKYYAAVDNVYEDGYVVTERGGITLPRDYVLDGQRILDFPVRHDDVWVVTFPKSGTTWTQEMVWLLMNDLDFKSAKEKCISDRFPYLEHTALLPKGCRDGAVNTIDKAQHQPPPRLIKSHLPPVLLPKQLWTVKPKIVYVCRNPKDTAISYYHHRRLLMNMQLSVDEFIEAFLENVVNYSPYWSSALEFWKLRNEPNVLWNTYEDMKKDLGAVIRKTAAFLGKSLTEEQVRQLEEHLSFSSMRDNPATNYSAVVQRLRAGIGLPPAPPDQAFMREGAVGRARQRMSPEVDRRFDQWIRDNIRGTGYDGPI
ncbi:luciferin sulfotransferase-like [Schistocerca nitens]|uniref:luciferin sulfotransferase-like n=1 Tax=Schistocerca nitens TaxID=7011 RepID=UPI002118A32C|nr:luciferin sulfotransferase-like [Schistocerca nitens]